MVSIADGYVGRDLEMTWNGSSIGGVREKGLKINGESIDVTSDDDDGWRKLLTVPGQKQFDISVSGVSVEHVLKVDWFNENFVRAVVITYPDGATISGDFRLSEYSEKGSYKDATVFEATLLSTGEFTYVAGV